MNFLRTILNRSETGAAADAAVHFDDEELLPGDEEELEMEPDEWGDEFLDDEALLDDDETLLHDDDDDDDDDEAEVDFDAAGMSEDDGLTATDGGDDAVEEAADEAGEEADDVPIWELLKEAEAEAEAEKHEQAADAPEAAGVTELARRAISKLDGIEEMPDPAPVGGRAKTRLLGFRRDADVQTDVFDRPQTVPAQAPQTFPVGWLVVIDGPGRGAQFSLYDGVAKIGRGTEQAVSLNFGDQAISRDNHAAIAYDPEQNAFYLGHGGKANLVRLNGKPLLTTEEVSNGDFIRIGETTLRLAALCCAEFSWDLVDDEADCA